jgi:hypothetical protein
MSKILKSNPLYIVPAKFIKMAIDNWTAETPKTAKVVQYTMLGVGATASIIPMIFTGLPVWTLGALSFTVVLSLQFLKK